MKQHVEMSVKQMDLASAAPVDGCAAKCVLICLAWYADDDGGSCYPSIPKICAWCSLSRQGVIDQLSKLEALGLLRIERSPGRATNQYRLTVKPVDCSPTPTVHPTDRSTVKPVDRSGGQQSTVRSQQSTADVPTVNAVDPIRQDPSLIHKKEKVGGVEKRSTIPNSTVIPIALNTPEFRAAWVMWLEHLKQRKKSPSLHAQDLQLRTLTTGGVEKAIETIHWSIEHNWQGLYEKDSTKKKEKPFINYKNPTGRCT